MKRQKNKIVVSSADGTKVEITNIKGTKLAIWKTLKNG